ncbi:MAG: hypothetical protein GEU91_16005 [Rhizobiales bacterium]|nr:hypothetical protein [Hyphomicrobiales bacterium]
MGPRPSAARCSVPSSREATTDMANHPKKMQDPTEAALSAIQQAIGGREVDKPAAAPDPTGALPETRRRSARPAAATTDEDLSLDEARPVARADEPIPPRRAANDDRQSIGQILQAIQRRPPRTSYVVATILAAAWGGAATFVAWLYLPELQAELTRGTLVAPALLGLAAVVLVPVIFFYVLAHAAWRSQELRLIAQSMTEVAIRLAEPETVAREAIVSVGQAIRREVAAMGDGVERALARAAELEALVHNEVSALEHAYNDNEIRIRGLLQDLANQRDALVGQAEQVRGVITGVNLDLTQDLSTVGDRVVDSVNDSAQRVSRMLGDKGEQMKLALNHASDSLIASLSERGDQLLQRLETTSHNATSAINAASERLTTSLDFKSDHVHGTFTKLADDLSQMMSKRLDGVTDEFVERSTKVVDMMAGRTGEFTASIVDAGSQVAETLLARVEDVNSTLKSTGDSLVLDFTLRGGEVVTQLDQTGARITDTIISRGNKVTDTFRESADNLAQTVEDSGEAVKTMLAARLQAFEDIFNHGGTEIAEKISRDGATLGNLITRHLAEFDRTVKTYGGEIVERLAARTEDVAEAMRSYVDGFDSRVATKTEEVGNSLDQRLERFQDTLDNRTAALNDSMSARVIEISQTLAAGGKDVVAALDRRVSEATDAIDIRSADLAETITMKINRIDEAIGNRATEVAENLETRISRFEELLIGRAEAVTEAIEVRSRAAADSLGARMDGISRAIEDNAAALRTSADEAERKLTKISENIGGSLIALSDNVGGSLTALSDNVGGSLTTLSDTVGGSLTTMSTEVTSVLRQNAGEVEQTLLGVSAEVARNFVGKADEITSAVSARTDELTSVLDDKSRILLDALGGKSQQFANEVTRVTEHAVSAIDAKGFAFTQTMMDNSETIARIINDASDNATASVARTLSELQRSAEETTASAATILTRTLQDLDNSTRSAIEYSKQTAAATVSEMLETHSMLRSDTTALFERLREANILLQEVLSGAHENMNSIEHTMVTRVSDFVATMNELTERSGTASNQVETHITEFHSVTTRALGDLSQLAGQFDTHGRSLAEAVALLDLSNRRTEDTVADRKMTLDTLISDLDARTTDLGDRLSRFSTLLDQSLEAAANRARDIARGIADSSIEGQKAVDESLEAATHRARDIARGIADCSLEGQRAVDESLEAAASHARDIARVITDCSLEGQRAVDESLGTAANRAREIAQVITESSNEGAQAIVDNFDRVRATAEEERQRTLDSLRGVYDQVTGETGEVFRQATERFQDAVSDMKQMAMEMKRELDTTRNELRRGILEMPQETAENAAQMRRVLVDQIEALAELNRIVARHGRGLDAADPARRGPRDEPALAAPAARSEAPLRPVMRGERAERTDGTAVVPGRRAESPSLSPALGNGRSGWLSDLLSRASREPEGGGAEPPRGEDRPPRHSIESLDSLSVDIARMIDHDAASELWDRYKRGERNVFTRRLYTLQGQQAFDEIRKKYRADREFKQTVDRYIDEFERLLEEVARDDRGQVVARTYLTSETGKVYTMLAHAAGRFD